jgi:hypothetical protein
MDWKPNGGLGQLECLDGHSRLRRPIAALGPTCSEARGCAGHSGVSRLMRKGNPDKMAAISQESLVDIISLSGLADQVGSPPESTMRRSTVHGAITGRINNLWST